MPEPHDHPRWAVPTLFLAVALASTSMYATWPIASVAAVQMSGATALAGIPGALGIVGTSLGSLWLGAMMARTGRRFGLRAGWTIGVLFALLGIAAIQTSHLSLLLLAQLGIGWANGASVLARYAAGEFVRGNRRGSAVGIVVWANTVGAITGPTLATTVGNRLARHHGLLEGTGAFEVAAIALGLGLACTIALPRMLPHAATDTDDAHSTPVAEPTDRQGIEQRRAAPLRVALLSLVVCQAAMVMPMSVTPEYLHHAHQSQGTIGLVMSSHFTGMFALAPLIGLAVDAIGSFIVIVAGIAVLGVGASFAGVFDPGLLMSQPLLLLGIGWSCSFVAASSVIARAAPPASASRFQGRIDAAVWLVAAAASSVSGLLMEWVGYRPLGIATGIVTAVAIVIALRMRHAQRVGAVP